MPDSRHAILCEQLMAESTLRGTTPGEYRDWYLHAAHVLALMYVWPGRSSGKSVEDWLTALGPQIAPLIQDALNGQG